MLLSKKIGFRSCLPLIKGPVLVRNNVCGFSGSFKHIEEQLAAFPEFREGREYEIQGKFLKALPAYQRVFESLHSAVGINSPLTTFLLYRLGNLHRYEGNRAKAIHLLTEHLPKVSNDLEEKVYLQQQLATLYLLTNQSKQALTVAEEAVNLCEAKNHDNNQFSKLLSSAYATYGLSHLFNQDIHEAETFLQMSCRWAETPAEQIVSAINNGNLVWFRLAQEQNSSSSPALFHYWKAQVEKLSKPVPFRASEGEKGSNNQTMIDKQSSLYKDHLIHTLNGWLEASEEIQKGSIVTGTTGCGPMNMTGLQSNDVTMVQNNSNNSSSKDKNANTDSSKEASSLESRLTNDTSLAIAYATLLFQIAEVYDLTGQYSTASEYLSSAMKAIQSPSQHPTQRLLVAPILSKLLREIGCAHMCNTQAVTAEGLYRSSIEKLLTPLIHSDPRYQWDMGLTKGYYGQLLLKWDKRESLGQQYQAESQQLLSPLVEEQSTRLPLTSMIQFPIDYLP